MHLAGSTQQEGFNSAPDSSVLPACVCVAEQEPEGDDGAVCRFITAPLVLF